MIVTEKPAPSSVWIATFGLVTMMLSVEIGNLSTTALIFLSIYEGLKPFGFAEEALSLTYTSIWIVVV